MIVSIPFNYEERGYEPRRTNETVAVRRGSVPVDIPDLTETDAPVAYRWTEKLDWRRRSRESTVRGTADGLVGVAGGPSRWDEDGYVPVAGKALVELVESGRADGENPFSHLCSQEPSPDSLVFRNGPPVVSGREKAETEVRAFASAFRFLDGVLWRPEAETVLVLDHETNADVLDLRRVETCACDGYKARESHVRVYRLDEWDVLREDARRLADEHGQRLELPDTYPHATVVAPEHLLYPSEDVALYTAVRTLHGELSEIVSKGLNDRHGRPKDWATGMANLVVPSARLLELWREATLVVRHDFDHSVPGKVADLVHRYADVADSLPEGRYTWQEDRVREAWTNLARAVGRHAARPARLDEGYSALAGISP